MKEKRNWPWFAPFCAALLAFIVASCAPSLSAPPHLVATWPVAGASLSVARHTLELTFNRPLQADASWAALWRDLPLGSKLSDVLSRLKLTRSAMPGSVGEAKTWG